MSLHEAVQSVKAIFKARRTAHKTEGKLAAAYREALVIMDAQKASGVPLAERLTGLHALLRDVWPFTRTWQYLCATCDDCGLEFKACTGDATCGRTKPHLPHSFGIPCWCQNGTRFRSKPKPNPEDFRDAGKSKPTRFGR